MTTLLYDFKYTDPSGYSYTGQVVSDSDVPAYNYLSGQTYNSPYTNAQGQHGSYVISGTGTPTTAPSGAVYQSVYTDATGAGYESYKYDPATSAYYDVKATGYDPNTGFLKGTTSTPAWGGIGLGNEYGYINTGTATAPQYHTYGGGGTAHADINPGTLSYYDFEFLYPDGSYYLGRVADDGTYGYAIGQTIQKGNSGAEYVVYNKEATSPPAGTKAGYVSDLLYYDSFTNKNYPPSDIIPNTTYYQKPVGYGGLGTDTDYIQQTDGKYYAFNDTTNAHSSPGLTAIPLPT
jgi:hypothetical protein